MVSTTYWVRSPDDGNEELGPHQVHIGVVVGDIHNACGSGEKFKFALCSFSLD